MLSRSVYLPLQRRDYALLAAVSLVLFGFGVVSGRPLTMHEAVLPQSAREMLADGDLVVPKKGGQPWLESPPLPQWITVALAAPLGRCDAEWIVRIGPTLVSTAVVLMVAWLAGLWYGRTIGLLAGLVMATTCEFTRYAWLAEDEIYLCGVVTAAMALFVRLEFYTRDEPIDATRGLLRGFFGSRPWLVLAFFIVLGMTNLVKGLLFGTVMTLVPIAGFLLWNWEPNRIRRYLWFWGWLAFLAVSVAWPLAAYWRFPDVIDVWNFDLGGRIDGSYDDITQPFWYYPVNLLWMVAPWTFVIPAGMWLTRNAALFERRSPERFLWCWALLVPLVFSLPSGKHHHYLLHALAPWAILGSLGLVKVRAWMRDWPHWLRNPWLSLATVVLPAVIGLWLAGDKIPGPSWIAMAIMIACPIITVGLTWAVHHRNPRFAGISLFTALIIGYCVGHSYSGHYIDRHRLDVAFLHDVRKIAMQTEKPLVVDMSRGPLNGFLDLFYLPPTVVPVHNVSFVLDERIQGDELYVLSMSTQTERLRQFGNAEIVSQSTGTKRGTDERLTLYHVQLSHELPRISAASVRVSPMQAMHRADGPFLTRQLTSGEPAVQR